MIGAATSAPNARPQPKPFARAGVVMVVPRRTADSSSTFKSFIPVSILPGISLLHRERRLVHEGDLLAQLEDAVLPVALGVEPGERRGKSGIVPAPRDPPRVVDEA